VVTYMQLARPLAANINISKGTGGGEREEHPEPCVDAFAVRVLKATLSRRHLHPQHTKTWGRGALLYVPSFPEGSSTKEPQTDENVASEGGDRFGCQGRRSWGGCQVCLRKKKGRDKKKAVARHRRIPKENAYGRPVGRMELRSQRGENLPLVCGRNPNYRAGKESEEEGG